MPTFGSKPPDTFKKESVPSSSCCSHKMCGHGGFGKILLFTFTGVLIVYLIVFVGSLISNNIKKYNFIGKADKTERTISVSGYGKVTGSNDIAMTTIGYSYTDKDVAKAQLETKKVMDKITADLLAMGVAQKDLQTDYSIYPDYNYTQNKGQELIGYRVSNQVTIKIKDLNKISDILSLSGKYGATTVSGLSFTIDDPESLKAEARAKAVADAKEKATVLEKTLGVRLVSVVSYYENTGGVDYYQPLANAKMMDLGMGGATGAGPAVVSGGSQDVVMNVTITYEIQ